MNDFLTQEELKALSYDKAREYAALLRSYLVETVMENGGHLASNLGVVEISLALSRVLDFPSDSVIYDTGHQCYVHKILTGRGKEFKNLRKKEGISGFPRREESPFDVFGTGHSGTALSAALGIQKAKTLKGKDGVTAVVIGDGSFGGGMVFEALNNIGPKDRVIIILNDNKMSIGKSVGTLRSMLNKLRTPGYYKFKSEVEDALSALPVVGKPLGTVVRGVKNSIKRQALPAGNFFEEMGLHYYGPADGHDLEKIELLLSEAKHRGGPSIIHLCTRKGKGFGPAETDPSKYHGVSPKGEVKKAGKSFSSIFGDAMVELGRDDEKIVCITSAMTSGVGLSAFEETFPERLFDTGIAEEHAMTFAAGLAAGGMKPCLALYATFFQRALDQFVHDAALQNLPCVVCLDRAGITGQDGATHHGLYDLPFIFSVPNVKLYAPISEKEMKKALKKAFGEENTPSVIRYPKGQEDPLLLEAFPCEEEIETVEFPAEGKVSLTLVTYSRMTTPSLVAAMNMAEKGIGVRVVRFATLKGFDKTKLAGIFSGAEKILFVEEAVEMGSFSQYLLSLLQKEGILPKQVKIHCIGEKFIPHGTPSELLCQEGLCQKGIEKEILYLAKT